MKYMQSVGMFLFVTGSILFVIYIFIISLVITTGSERLELKTIQKIFPSQSSVFACLAIMFLIIIGGLIIQGLARENDIAMKSFKYYNKQKNK